MNQLTPAYLKTTANESYWRRPRGMLQKNVALDWLRSNTKATDDGLVYFADDDNAYHWRLFQEVRICMWINSYERIQCNIFV